MPLERLELVSLPLDLAAFDEIVDVRSPSEFAADHLPAAVNLPVLNDTQRAEIGTLYKRNAFEARRLGAALICESATGYLKGELSTRGRGWSPLLYCWRGGLRSKSFATILRAVGWRARVLEGGYKSWRRFVIADLERILGGPAPRFHILAGLTGSGKTRLLHSLREAGAQVVDLEALANHRGSLLGTCGNQPSQKRFESLVHAALRDLDFSRPVFAEAESNRIGSVYVPPALWRRFSEATVVEITLPLAARVALLLEDYAHFPKEPGALSRLLDELRPLRGHRQVDTWQAQISAGAWSEFVGALLEGHYDLCYRRPGSSGAVYQPPARRLAIPDISAPSFRAAAAELVAWASRIPVA